MPGVTAITIKFPKFQPSSIYKIERFSL